MEITLETKDRQFVSIPRKYAEISGYVRKKIEPDSEFPLLLKLDFPSEHIEDVVQYMYHHAGIEAPLVKKPLKGCQMVTNCDDPWDAHFIDNFDTKPHQLFSFINTVAALEIPGLIHLGCAKIASLIKKGPLENMQDNLAFYKPIQSTPLVKKSWCPTSCILL